MEREAINRLIIAAEYLLDGRSIAWVAREFGYPTSQISQLAGILGLSPRSRSSPRTVNLDKYDQVEQAILEGWPIGEIERTTKVHRDTINRWFPDRPKMSPEEAGELAQMYKESKEAREKWRKSNDWSSSTEGPGNTS